MNPIINKLIDARNGHYVHAIEVESKQGLVSLIDDLFTVFADEGFSNEDIKDFFLSASIYSLNEENEEEIYNFDASEYIEDNYM